MEPFSFALGQIDAVGKHQPTDDYGNAIPVDGAFKMYWDEEFIDFSGAKDFVTRAVSHPRARECGVLKVRQHAFGRVALPPDGCSLQQIRDQVGEGDGSYAAMMREIVLSRPFRHVRIEG